jgi:hypothetical protein
MSVQTIAADRAMLEHWRRVGPLLEEVRRRELQNYDHAASWPAVRSLLDLAVLHGQPRTTSGLVELQRLFQRASR